MLLVLDLHRSVATCLADVSSSAFAAARLQKCAPAHSQEPLAAFRVLDFVERLQEVRERRGAGDESGGVYAEREQLEGCWGVRIVGCVEGERDGLEGGEGCGRVEPLEEGSVRVSVVVVE